MGRGSGGDAFGPAGVFVAFVKQGGLFDALVADGPLELTRPNAPAKRDVVGTLVLSVLAGHRRHAHITCLRSDGVSPDLLGMKRIVSEDAIRRPLSKIDESRGIAWLRRHLDDVSGRCCASPGSSTWTRRSSRSTGSGRERW